MKKKDIVPTPVVVHDPPVAAQAPATPVPPVNPLKPILDAMLGGGDNLGNAVCEVLYICRGIGGQVDLTKMFDEYMVPTHQRNRIVTLFRQNKRFSVGYVSPLIARRTK